MEFAIVAIVFLYMIIGGLIASFWYIYKLDIPGLDISPLIGIMIAIHAGMIMLFKDKDKDNEENAPK